MPCTGSHILVATQSRRPAGDKLPPGPRSGPPAASVHRLLWILWKTLLARHLTLHCDGTSVESPLPATAVSARTRLAARCRRARSPRPALRYPPRAPGRGDRAGLPTAGPPADRCPSATRCPRWRLRRRTQPTPAPVAHHAPGGRYARLPADRYSGPPVPAARVIEKSGFPIINRNSGVCGTRVSGFYTFSTAVEDAVENLGILPAKWRYIHEETRSRRTCYKRKSMDFPGFYPDTPCGKCPVRRIQWPSLLARAAPTNPERPRLGDELTRTAFKPPPGGPGDCAGGAGNGRAGKA